MLNNRRVYFFNNATHKLPNTAKFQASPKQPAPSFFCTWILGAGVAIGFILYLWSVYMDLYGFYMDLYGFYMDLYGYIWILYGFIWILYGFYMDFIWILYGFIWILYGFILDIS
jgi:hypothetical protein